MDKEQKDRMEVRKLLGLPVFKKVSENNGPPVLKDSDWLKYQRFIHKEIFLSKTSIHNLGFSENPTEENWIRHVIYKCISQGEPILFVITVFLHNENQYKPIFFSSALDQNLNLGFLDFLLDLDPSIKKEILSVKKAIGLK